MQHLQGSQDLLPQLQQQLLQLPHQQQMNNPAGAAAAHGFVLSDAVSLQPVATPAAAASAAAGPRPAADTRQQLLAQHQQQQQYFAQRGLLQHLHQQQMQKQQLQQHVQPGLLKPQQLLQQQQQFRQQQAQLQQLQQQQLLLLRAADSPGFYSAFCRLLHQVSLHRLSLRDARVRVLLVVLRWLQQQQQQQAEPSRLFREGQFERLVAQTRAYMQLLLQQQPLKHEELLQLGLSPSLGFRPNREFLAAVAAAGSGFAYKPPASKQQQQQQQRPRSQQLFVQLYDQHLQQQQQRAEEVLEQQALRFEEIARVRQEQEEQQQQQQQQRQQQQDPRDQPSSGQTQVPQQHQVLSYQQQSDVVVSGEQPEPMVVEGGERLEQQQQQPQQETVRPDAEAGVSAELSNQQQQQQHSGLLQTQQGEGNVLETHQQQLLDSGNAAAKAEPEIAAAAAATAAEAGHAGDLKVAATGAATSEGEGEGDGYSSAEECWGVGGMQRPSDDGSSAAMQERARISRLQRRLLALGPLQRQVREEVIAQRLTETPQQLPPLQHMPVRLARKHRTLRLLRERGDRLTAAKQQQQQQRQQVLQQLLDSHRRSFLQQQRDVLRQMRRVAAAVKRRKAAAGTDGGDGSASCGHPLHPTDCGCAGAAATAAQMRKERLDALRKHDEAGYLKLLQETKNERLLQLVRQTEGYMQQIGSLVVEQREREGIIVPVTEEATDGAEEASGSLSSSFLFSKERYYRITHSQREKVTELPSCLKGGTLRSYQMEGLNWLVSLHNNGLNGILADCMGLGKTVQTVSFLAYLYEKKGVRNPHLILAPLSTLHGNWRLEFKKWWPSLRIVVYEGAKDVRKALRSRIVSGVRVEGSGQETQRFLEPQFDVLLTTDAFVLRDKSFLKKIQWEYLIVDEAHRLKNPNSKLVQTLNSGFSIRRRIALTGTPLQNDIVEVWALLNFLMPSIFNAKLNFEQWLNVPLGTAPAERLGTGTGGEDQPHLMTVTEEEKLLIIDRLHKVLRPFLLRREKAEVADELPSKQEEIVWCPLSGVQRILYRIIEESPMGHNRMVQLRKVCNHPFLFCFSNFTPDESLVRCCGKFAMLDVLLPALKAAHHRVLVFSQMTKLLDLLEAYLSLRGYRYLRLDGGTSSEERQTRLALYNQENSPYFLFILSTKAGGLGVNLQSADTVIIFDSDWNPQNDEQAQARAHRIGQKREVLTIRFVTPSSVEEQILHSAELKLDKDALVIKSGMYNGELQDRETERQEQVREILRRRKQLEANLTRPFDFAILKNQLSRNPAESRVFDALQKIRQLLHLPGLIYGEAVPPCLFRWSKTAERSQMDLVQNTEKAAQDWKWGYSLSDFWSIQRRKKIPSISSMELHFVGSSNTPHSGVRTGADCASSVSSQQQQQQHHHHQLRQQQQVLQQQQLEHHQLQQQQLALQLQLQLQQQQPLPLLPPDAASATPLPVASDADSSVVPSPAASKAIAAATATAAEATELGRAADATGATEAAKSADAAAASGATNTADPPATTTEQAVATGVADAAGSAAVGSFLPGSTEASGVEAATAQTPCLEAASAQLSGAPLLAPSPVAALALEEPGKIAEVAAPSLEGSEAGSVLPATAEGPSVSVSTVAAAPDAAATDVAAASAAAPTAAAPAAAAATTSAEPGAAAAVLTESGGAFERLSSCGTSPIIGSSAASMVATSIATAAVACSAVEQTATATTDAARVGGSKGEPGNGGEQVTDIWGCGDGNEGDSAGAADVCVANPQRWKQMLNAGISQALTDAIKDSRFSAFVELPSETVYKDYYERVSKPVCLLQIRKFADRQEFTSLSKLEKYLTRLAENARAYNGQESPLFLRSLECTGAILMRSRVNACIAFHTLHSPAQGDRIRQLFEVYKSCWDSTASTPLPDGETVGQVDALGGELMEAEAEAEDDDASGVSSQLSSTVRSATSYSRSAISSLLPFKRGPAGASHSYYDDYSAFPPSVTSAAPAATAAAWRHPQMQQLPVGAPMSSSSTVRRKALVRLPARPPSGAASGGRGAAGSKKQAYTPSYLGYVPQGIELPQPNSTKPAMLPPYSQQQPQQPSKKQRRAAAREASAAASAASGFSAVPYSYPPVTASAAPAQCLSQPKQPLPLQMPGSGNQGGDPHMSFPAMQQQRPLAGMDAGFPVAAAEQALPQHYAAVPLPAGLGVEGTHDKKAKRDKKGKGSKTKKRARDSSPMQQQFQQPLQQQFQQPLQQSLQQPVQQQMPFAPLHLQSEAAQATGMPQKPPEIKPLRIRLSFSNQQQQQPPQNVQQSQPPYAYAQPHDLQQQQRQLHAQAAYPPVQQQVFDQQQQQQQQLQSPATRPKFRIRLPMPPPQ